MLRRVIGKTEVMKPRMPASTKGAASCKRTGLSLSVTRGKDTVSCLGRVPPSVVLFSVTKDAIPIYIRPIPVKVYLGLTGYISSTSSMGVEGTHDFEEGLYRGNGCGKGRYVGAQDP